jgi:hypothetical protein
MVAALWPVPGAHALYRFGCGVYRVPARVMADRNSKTRAQVVIFRGSHSEITLNATLPAGRKLPAKLGNEPKIVEAELAIHDGGLAPDLVELLGMSPLKDPEALDSTSAVRKLRDLPCSPQKAKPGDSAAAPNASLAR